MIMVAQLHLFAMQMQMRCFDIGESSISSHWTDWTVFDDDLVELARRMAAGEFGSATSLLLVSYTCFGAAIDV